MQTGKFIFRMVVSLAWLARIAAAQSIQFEGPVLGVFYEARYGLRPIQGVPGGAYLGPRLMGGESFASAAGSGKLALAWTPDGVWAVELNGGNVARTRVEGALERVDRVAWAPDTSTAVLYASESRRLQRVRFAQGAPHVEAPFDLPLPGPVTALAVASTGGPIVVGVVGEDMGGLYRIDAGGAVQRLDHMSHPAAAVFARTGNLMYAADRNSGRVLVFQGDSPAVFAEEKSQDLVGLAVSGDSRFLFVAGASPSSLRIYDCATRSQTGEIVLDFKPLTLVPISDKAHHLMTDGNGVEPVWILSDSPPSTVYFVPAGELL